MNSVFFLFLIICKCWLSAQSQGSSILFVSILRRKDFIFEKI